jgi:CRP-like cAMP-binding protein
MAVTVQDHRASIDNQLLAALPVRDYMSFAGDLDEVSLERSRVIVEAGRPLDFVYFLNSGVASVTSTGDAGAEIEVALVGREGFVGMPAFLGSTSSFGQTSMLVPGDALRMRAEVFEETSVDNPRLRDMLLRFTHALLVQVSVSVSCTASHSVDERFARWLLTVFDRAAAREVLLTHEEIARALNVRRSGVSVAARALQEADLIAYTRGRIRLVDHEGLERRACGCYRIIRDEIERLAVDYAPRRRR